MNSLFPANRRLDAQIVSVTVLFFLSAWLGHSLAFEGMHTLPTWPPTGIGLACMLIMGRQVWPGITIGSLIASLLVNSNSDNIPAHSIIILSSSVAAADTIEILLGNFLIKNWMGTIYPFTAAKSTFRFLFVTLGMCVVGSLISTSALSITGIVEDSALIKLGLFNCIGSIVGVLLFAPVILSLSRKIHVKLTRENIAEAAVFIVIVAASVFVLRNGYFDETFERAMPFIVLPVLLWMAFKYDLVFSMTTVLCISLVAIYFTAIHRGPFVLATADHSAMLVQIFIAVLSMSTIVLSATVREREDAQQALENFNDTLELKISERTQALNEENQTRKIAEQKLVQTNAELSKRNTELDNFVYSVSHDLRAPISSVLGLINLARKDEGVLKDQYLDMIFNSAKQQDHFITEILDQSRNSRLEVKREEIGFEFMIDETFTQLRFASPNGSTVKKIVNVRQDRPFYSDRWRLKVIFNNIISNSIRYRNGKDPVIEVKVNVSETGALVEIQDNGKGIAAEHIHNVCKMFYRATDDGAGSGLGLYIVKETVDKLNGTLKIDSEEGKGTRVSLQIPEVA